MDEEDFDVRREMTKLPLDIRILYDLIVESKNGVPVVHIKPELITSTADSTGSFSVEGKVSEIISI